MRCMNLKLRSQTGASILLALVFLLICCLVGAVTLTAATVNAGKLNHLRQDQQDYMAVSSAICLVRDELQTVSFTVETTTVTGLGGSASSVSYASSGGGLKELVASEAEKLQKGFAAAEHPISVTTEFTQPVSGNFTMAPDYTIIATAQIERANGASNPVTLTLKAENNAARTVSSREVEYDTGLKNPDGSPIYDTYVETTEIHTETYTWPQSAITRGVP